MNKFKEKWSNLAKVHYSHGSLYINANKEQALSCMKEDELKAVYYLSESLCPGLRFKATYSFEKAVEVKSSLPISKQCIAFKCVTEDETSKIQEMLQWNEEMPKEWTLVQLTSKYNEKDFFELNNEQLQTNAMHVSIFDCGRKWNPFCITLDPPVDKITGDVIEIRQEMANIITENKQNLMNAERLKIISVEQFKKQRSMFNTRLRDLIVQLQNWLKEWRCLFIGKLVDNNLEELIEETIDKLLQNVKVENISKVKYTLKSLAKGQNYLNLLEKRSIVKSLFTEDDQKPLRLNIIKVLKQLGEQYKFHLEKRHPVILIIDEKLDLFPWHMMDVIEEYPVSRMPSLHFTYALFKEYENRIENGLVIGFKSTNGNYIVNPSSDLANMEKRLCAFFDYWMPNWSGITGKAPTEDEFLQTLTSGDIFLYSGHGNGTQFLPEAKIQRTRISSLVLLFGCSSIKLKSLGPQVEMYGSYQMYLIACCPCLVGMLWEVTDIDCDLITTEFLSLCIRTNSASVHWKNVDKTLWEFGEQIIVPKKTNRDLNKNYEPQVLSALVKSRKCARSFCNQAACVARGLPVKVD